MLPIYSHTISFHKRQALVTYMENNRAGITVYGFMLDRTWLHSIFVHILNFHLLVESHSAGYDIQHVNDVHLVCIVLRSCKCVHVSSYSAGNILISDDTQDKHVEVKSWQQAFAATYTAETSLKIRSL
ncbi:hypothetical protein TSUD_379850 [Trifolium subterraneum]|uniref:Uncharacterized protein n=1 Tax=Trifolium subterraneum TaxID=3900 RepID=A0A2Z6N1M2_TRISU|nr:hypothetical protein TSUD_379850 [Trifolium subterraneum]